MKERERKRTEKKEIREKKEVSKAMFIWKLYSSRC